MESSLCPMSYVYVYDYDYDTMTDYESMSMSMSMPLTDYRIIIVYYSIITITNY